MRAMTEVDRTSARASWSPLQFVLLPENRSAVLAVRRLARCLGPSIRHSPFTPLLLHGPPGSGKTHLADQLLQWAANDHTVVRREAAEWAASEEEHPIDEGKTCGLLIVEDLQHLSDRAVDAFTAVLDHRIARRQPTLLTAAHGPTDLTNLPNRIISRLVGGLVVSLDPLAVPSRRRLLERLTVWRKLSLPVDALDWLASNTPGSGRQLIAALNRLQTMSQAQPTPPDVATVEAHFRSDVETRQPTVERITQQVGRLYEVSPKSIRGRDRQPGILLPRHVSMYLARELTDLTLAQIGAFFGRDHSTVRHACQKVAESLASDAELAAKIRQLRAGIGSSE
jgi:chromosomal replication initiator protein